MSLLRLKARGQRLFACLALVTALVTPACQKPDSSNLPGVEGPELVQPTPHEPEQPPVVPERMEPSKPPMMTEVDPKVPPVRPPPDRPRPPPDPQPMAALPKFISAGPPSQNGSSDGGFGNAPAAGTGGAGGTSGGSSSAGAGGMGAGDNNSGGDGDSSSENGGGATDERTPEEGDIFRVLDDQRIVNLTGAKLTHAIFSRRREAYELHALRVERVLRSR